MVGIPTLLVLFFILLPDDPVDRAVVHDRGTASAASTGSSWSASRTTCNLFTEVPAVLAGAVHTTSCGWPVFLFVATPLGMFFAVLLDKKIRGTRFYQGALYMPVVLSLAIVGFIWQLQYSPDQGFLNNVLGTRPAMSNFIDWLGDQDLNLWAVLVAASWRHIGYVMVLYLAGPEGGRPQPARGGPIDGANERQTFFRVVFPVLQADQRRGRGHHGHRVAARLRHRLRHQQGHATAWSCCRSWSPTTSSARRAGSASARPSRSCCW